MIVVLLGARPWEGSSSLGHCAPGWRCGFPGRDSVDLGRQLDLQAGKQRGHGGAHLGDLLHMHAATFVLDDLDGFEMVTDIAPGVPGADLGDALDKQGQHAQGDVRADPMWRPVEDGSRAQATLVTSPPARMRAARMYSLTPAY